MVKILIVYGTTDGHTQKVAKVLAENFMNLGCSVTLVDAKHDGSEYSPTAYDAVIVTASVHASGYQRSVKRWVRQYAPIIERRANAFISVCLGVLQKDEKVQTELNMIMGRFFDSVGWLPLTTLIVAGAIPYTRYNFIKKYLMKRIARKAGAGLDTKCDYEYTDWEQLRTFACDFLYDHNLLGKTAEMVQVQVIQGQYLS